MKNPIFKYKLLSTKNILSLTDSESNLEIFIDAEKLDSLYNIGLAEQEKDLDSKSGREKIQTFLEDYNNVLSLKKYFLEKKKKNSKKS